MVFEITAWQRRGTNMAQDINPNLISHDSWQLAGDRSYYEIDGYPDGTIKIVGKVVNGVRVELSEDEKNNIPQYGGQINKNQQATPISNADNSLVNTVDNGGIKP